MIQEIENNKLCGACRRGIFLDGVVDGFYYCAVCNHQILFSVMDAEGKQSTGCTDCHQHQIQNVMDTGVEEENEVFYLLSYTRRKTTPFTKVMSEQISPLVPEEVVEFEFGGPLVVGE